MYDFDQVIDRRGTACYKYDSLEEHFGRSDLYALWVADMDFKTPDFILDALRERLEHPVLGYALNGKDFFPIISSWVERLHGWSVPAEHICYIPGIVKGIGLAERCFLSPGDKVIIQPPVYHPFKNVTQACGFEVVNNPLTPIYNEDGSLKTYEMDLDGLEKLIDERTKMLILCNPHNPCGVCHSRESLRRLAHICKERGVVVVSDEIHAEMVLGGGLHVPFASVSEEAAECAVTFMAPSKTFNIAGVVSSYCIIESDTLREKFFKYLSACELDDPSLFSIVATKAAYSSSEADIWRREMLSYVESNIDFVCDWFKSNLPEICPVRPQASFLIWLDCRKLGLNQKQLVELFVDYAHLALNDGTMFGEEGTGYMRLNVACPRQILSSALKNLAAAVKIYKNMSK
ncbi:MAG TPA: cystathionine beta-lyase [Rikenellaceae bacterium]|nr:cystathionine beta-lyase [Rikenellaceae bacterium]HBH21628.1 cystathionine beta-lyase [Rikenellaceae bacterium]